MGEVAGRVVAVPFVTGRAQHGGDLAGGVVGVAVDAGVQVVEVGQVPVDAVAVVAA